MVAGAVLGLQCVTPGPTSSAITEFCLSGRLDIGARYQGTRPQPGEWMPTTWCVVTEDDSRRVLYSATGKINPDMDNSWAVAYVPPDLVRIVNRDTPPDVEFRGTDDPEEALRVRRLDPRRLLEELHATPEGLEGLQVETEDGRLTSVATTADLPLRGRVPVRWQWDWTNASAPTLLLQLDDEVLFEATGRWRDVPESEAAELWSRSPGADPIQAPAEGWPAQIDMRSIDVDEDVYLVRGVRTGFQHLVVDTEEGLIVADAPAGWVEFHHLPPSDLVPGLGVSGLSEMFVDFLGEQFPGRPIRAVALTHFHDDHAGGGRAFAAAGAQIYAPAESAQFLRSALNAPTMPDDRLTRSGRSAEVVAVSDSVTLGSEPDRVSFVSLGPGPHAAAMLGVWVRDRGRFFVSDVHVPRSDDDAPRAGREETECWFAEWAVEHLPSETLVANSHSPQVSPVSRLARYLDSDACRQQRSD